MAHSPKDDVRQILNRVLDEFGIHNQRVVLDNEAGKLKFVDHATLKVDSLQFKVSSTTKK